MKVVLLGSGNVATHLGRALLQAAHQILQVYSRTRGHAAELAEALGAEAIDSFDALGEGADIYILSVSDDAIAALAAAFPFKGKLIVHTSGTTDLDVLNSASAATGVFYPLQTFSKQKPVDFKVIPVAVEGNSREVTELLKELAEGISGKVLVMDSAKRRVLHVAAVFACNFSNHLYTLAGQILEREELDFDLLRPLIAETAAKAQLHSPYAVQTGPAVRGDEKTMERHLNYLQWSRTLQDLYAELSGSIIRFHNKDQ